MNSQPSECSDERQKLHLRSKTTTENTNWAVSVYEEKLFFFEKMLKQHLHAVK